MIHGIWRYYRIRRISSRICNVLRSHHDAPEDLAIASNLAFIAYAASEGLIPVLVLHSVLLPVNLARLYEIIKLLAFTRTTPARDASIEAMLPFMRQTKIQKVNTCSGKATTRDLCTI